MTDETPSAIPEVDESSDLTLVKTKAEIENIKVLTRKAKAEAENAEAQYKEFVRRRSFYERILSTSQATIALALLTVIFQVFQFGYTSYQTRKADESKEWKAAVDSASFAGDAKAVAGAMELETFLDTKEHGPEALEIVAAVIPSVQVPDAFDQLFANFARHDGWSGSDPQIYYVARSVATAYETKADIVYADSNDPVPLQGRFREDLSSVIRERKVDLSSGSVVDAQRLEWLIDTITRGLIKFWQVNNTKPTGAPGNYQNRLGAIIFRVDGDGLVDLHNDDLSYSSFTGAYMHHVDLTNAHLEHAQLNNVDLGCSHLKLAHLDNASVSGANFDQVTDFEGSSWKDVKWWEAGQLSPQLCGWLGQHGDVSGGRAPKYPVAACERPVRADQDPCQADPPR